MHRKKQEPFRATLSACPEASQLTSTPSKFSRTLNGFCPERNNFNNDVSSLAFLSCSYVIPSFCLPLINRAGGLYGRILTEVVSTDRTQ